MSKNIEIIALTKKMLREAIDKNTYWKDSLVPLPKSKALWLVSNTRIEEDDYCGVLGFEDKKMISFIFMFPDLLNNNGIEIKKIYWMIVWWVHTKHKNSVLGTYIYNEAVNLANKQVIIKSYAEKITDFYEKQPFTIITSKLRYTLFFSLDSSILIGRFSFLKSFKFVLDKAGAIVGSIVRLINKSKLKTTTLRYDYITQLDDETWKFIEPLCKDDLILKTKEYINWQINNLQYTQTPISKKYSSKSLISGNSYNIHLHNVKIIHKNNLIGFLSYTLNYNEFNIKYFLVKENENYEICIDALIEHFIKAKTNFIFTDDTKLYTSIHKKYRTIFTHKVIKKGLAHNETKLDFKNLNLLNRDGHFY